MSTSLPNCKSAISCKLAQHYDRIQWMGNMLTYFTVMNTKTCSFNTALQLQGTNNSSLANFRKLMYMIALTCCTRLNASNILLQAGLLPSGYSSRQPPTTYAKCIITQTHISVNQPVISLKFKFVQQAVFVGRGAVTESQLTWAFLKLRTAINQCIWDHMHQFQITNTPTVNQWQDISRYVCCIQWYYLCHMTTFLLFEHQCYCDAYIIIYNVFAVSNSNLGLILSKFL